GPEKEPGRTLHGDHPASRRLFSHRTRKSGLRPQFRARFRGLLCLDERALLVAAAFLVISYTYPKVLAPLNLLWMKFGLLLHKIVTPVILGLLFFVTITP